MTDFDKSTERKAEEYLDDTRKKYPNELFEKHALKYDFTAGRNSAKESLEILARDVEISACNCDSRYEVTCHRCETIAAVKARGDWPLEAT